MTYTEIDPKIVREIAEAAFRSDVGGDLSKRVEAALIASGVASPVVSEKFDAWSAAVGAEYDRLESESFTSDDPAGELEAWLAGRSVDDWIGRRIREVLDELAAVRKA